jgi:hypothetical protein
VIEAVGLDTLAGGGIGFFAEGAFLESLAGALEATAGDFTDLPEDFRDREGLEIFFNGAQVRPKSRAWKDRRSLP